MRIPLQKKVFEVSDKSSHASVIMKLSTTIMSALACAVLAAQPGFSAPLSTSTHEVEVARRQTDLNGWDTATIAAANAAQELEQNIYNPTPINPNAAASSQQQFPATGAMSTDPSMQAQQQQFSPTSGTTPGTPTTPTPGAPTSNPLTPATLTVQGCIQQYPQLNGGAATSGTQTTPQTQQTQQTGGFPSTTTPTTSTTGTASDPMYAACQNLIQTIGTGGTSSSSTSSPSGTPLPTQCTTTYAQSMQRLATFPLATVQQWLGSTEAAQNPDLKNCVMLATNGGTTTFNAAATTSGTSGTTQPGATSSSSQSSSSLGVNTGSMVIGGGNCPTGAPSSTTCYKYQTSYSTFCSAAFTPQTRANWFNGPDPQKDPCIAGCMKYYLKAQPIPGCTVQGM